MNLDLPKTYSKEIKYLNSEELFTHILTHHN